jgi:hypothetical protein
MPRIYEVAGAIGRLRVEGVVKGHEGEEGEGVKRMKV